MDLIVGGALGLLGWFFVRVLLVGFFTVDQNERAVKTRFGRAVRVGSSTTLDDPIASYLRPEERPRYAYPQVRVIQPGGPYFKMPWERVHKVSIATNIVNMALDPEQPSANEGARGSRRSPRISSTPGSPARSGSASPRAICTRSSSASRSRSCT